ncbi:MAG: ABC transporter substrate-binding protein [Gaiellaceae bacterium]
MDIIGGDVRMQRVARAGISEARRSLLLRLTLTFALVCLPAVTACGEKHEPTGPTVALYPVSVIDADHNEVVLKTAPKRVAVAGQSPLQLAVSLDLHVTPVDERSGNLNIPLIRSLRPELILAGSEISETSLTTARALGIAVYVVPDTTLGGIERALSDVSLLVGTPLRGRAARERVASVREDVHTALASAAPVRVFFDSGKFATVSATSFIGSVIGEAGGIDVAGPDPQEGPFPLTRLRQLRPEVFVVASGLPLTLAEMRRNRLLKGLPATRNDRIIHVDMRLLEPGPEAVTALLELAKAFHPDAFR